MSEIESLSDSIRRKVAEKQAEALKAISDCETTEVSASSVRPKSLVVAAAIAPQTANPLMPVCIGLAITVLVLLMLLLMRGFN